MARVTPGEENATEQSVRLSVFAVRHRGRTEISRRVVAINPLIGSAGIASIPIAARVSHIVANQENPHNHLIFHAMGPNLAGVFGTAISGEIMLALLGVQ